MKVISNTAYYNRKEQVNGYSGTLYNLSYFQHFLDPNSSLNVYGYPSDPLGTECDACSSQYPLLNAKGLNLPGLPNYVSTNLITNAQQNFTQEIRVQNEQFGGAPAMDGGRILFIQSTAEQRADLRPGASATHRKPLALRLRSGGPVKR